MFFKWGCIWQNCPLFQLVRLVAYIHCPYLDLYLTPAKSIADMQIRKKASISINAHLKTCNTTCVKINISYFNVFPHFIFKYRQVYMTEATLNDDNNIDICSIYSKFYIHMYDSIIYIYAKKRSNMHCYCVWKAVHNITFWRTLVSKIEKVPRDARIA